MSNVLGLSGSPIKGGSTEILVQEVLRGAASSGAQTEYICLNDLRIMPCQSCGKSPEAGYCFFRDDMDPIYRSFDRCEALVIGSPMYFDSVSAQTKLFIDRTNCFRQVILGERPKFGRRHFKERKGAMVLVGGQRERFEYARRVISGFFVWADVKGIGLITYSHDDWEAGSVIHSPNIMRQAFELGVKLTA